MKTRALATWVAGAALAGCGRPSAPHGTDAAAQPAASARAGTAESGLTCNLVAAGADNRYSVTLLLENKTRAAVTLRYFHPLAFALSAWIEGKPVPLRVPAIDMPVQPRTVELGAEQTLTITTPTSLSFGSGSRESDRSEPFRIWLDHAPARARLSGERAFASHPSLVCGGWLEPK